jgi:hypothetical protein
MSLHRKKAQRPASTEPNVRIKGNASGCDGRTNILNETQVYCDVSILVHQLRHLQAFYRALVALLDICEENNAKIMK